MAMAMANTMASAALLPSFDGLRAQSPCQKAASSAPTTSGSPAYQLLSVVADKRVQKRRQVILTEDVQYLGKTGALLAVKTGYFRNFLYPAGKAKLATPEILKAIRLEEERKAVKAEAEGVARLLQNAGMFTLRRKRGGQGKQIFGSVTSQDVVDIIRANAKQEVDKREVTVPEVREVGQYVVEIKLHPEVIAQVKINVVGQ
jgi:large subunit ribosomal protein L9